MTDARDVERDLQAHKLEDEKQYGEIRTYLAKVDGKIEVLKTTIGQNSKLVWFVFTILIAFEINAIMKLVGYD